MTKTMLYGLLVLIFFSLSVAADPTLSNQIIHFTACIYSLLPPISLLLVVAAAATYAAGQLTSAETRARATGWATAMVVGALFGFVLVAIFPGLIQAFYPQAQGIDFRSTSCTLW